MNMQPDMPRPPCPPGATFYAALLPVIRAGTLSPGERAALRGHLLVCSICRDEAAAAADQVVAEGVRRQFGIPTQESPFLSLDDIRRAALAVPDGARNGATSPDRSTRPITLRDKGMIMISDETQPESSDPSDSAPSYGQPFGQSILPVSVIKPPTRWRTIAGVASAVALIALFALLLRGFAAGKGSPGVGSPSNTVLATRAPAQTAPAATPAAHGQWHTVDAMTYTTQVFTQTPYPQFSPKDPAIVYETTLTPITLRRSDNSGATWQALRLPSGSEQAIDIEIFPSPLDAHAAFLTITTNLAYGQGTNACPSSSRLASAAGATHGNILASGQVPCSTTYRTIDEGKSWHALTFPVNGTISSPLSDSAPYAGTPIQAQGTRLYAMLDCGPSCVSPGSRLVTSTDGGLRWTEADGGGLGQGICDFAAQPGSNTIFAAVSRGSCDVLNSPALAIDRSDDAGQSWVHVSFLPQGASQGMTAVTVGGKHLLYVNLPAVTWQPHIISVGQAANQFLVSSDGGATWKASSLKGVPSKALPVTAPLIVRSDGSLVVAFAADTPGTNATLYSWMPGDASWKEFAPTPRGQVSTLLRTVSPTGVETFWAVIDSGSVQQSNNVAFTYTVASYQP